MFPACVFRLVLTREVVMKVGRKLPRVVGALALLWSLPLFAAPQYALSVDGLACPFCAYGIEKKLLSVEGVKRIDVDIDAGRVIVTMDEGATLEEPAARQAVNDAGFTLRKFEVLEE